MSLLKLISLLSFIIACIANSSRLLTLPRELQEEIITLQDSDRDITALSLVSRGYYRTVSKMRMDRVRTDYNVLFTVSHQLTPMDIMNKFVIVDETEIKPMTRGRVLTTDGSLPFLSIPLIFKHQDSWIRLGTTVIFMFYPNGTIYANDLIPEPRHVTPKFVVDILCENIVQSGSFNVYLYQSRCIIHRIIDGTHEMFTNHANKIHNIFGPRMMLCFVFAASAFLFTLAALLQ